MKWRRWQNKLFSISYSTAADSSGRFFIFTQTKTSYMRLCIAFLLLITSLPECFAQSLGPICITSVTVVDVKTGKLVPDQVVIIQNDRITTIGSSKKIKPPAGATIIDGAGKFLMPGMTDAHIHFFQSGGLYTRPDALNLGSVYSYEKDQQWV